MQAPLAMIGFIAGLLAWWQSDDWRWLLGAVLLVANWPYTIFGIMPINKKLMATEPRNAGGETRRLIERWAVLHTGRTGLGFAATGVLLWASLR